MKFKASRIFTVVFCIIFTLSMSVITLAQPAFAAQEPVFDATFDGGKGALFANGTPIVISKTEGKTVASWPGGSAEIPPDAKVFGGGVAQTSFETSCIKLESGTVAALYGGGFSTDPLLPASVGRTSVIIDGGVVTGSAYAGGLLYSRVSDANITINDGSVLFLVGGGQASATIDGVGYNTGTEAAPQDSGTVVEKGNVVVNGGAISYVFGGGQGYSYTRKTFATVNDGNILYLTAGGSNGLTDDADVTIKGGTIGTYQSVNRGTVNDAKLKMKNGIVETLFVGSEEAPDATGILNGATVNIVGGRVGELNSGKSNDVPLVITRTQFDVVYVDDIVAIKNIIGDAVSITAKVVLTQKNIELAKSSQMTVPYSIVTVPEGHEGLFESETIKWSSADESIVTVQNGVVKCIGEGSTVISATLNNESDIAQVSALGADPLFIMILLLIFAAVIIILIIITVIYNRR